MPQILQREIDKLKKMILSEGAIVEESVRKAVHSIEGRDEQLAQEVVNSDAVIDQMEIDVEEEGLKILALHQPVAIDLRFIVAVLKINNDLERIGDLAVNIGERAVVLARIPKVELPNNHLPAMAIRAQAMLKNCLDALVNLDADLARKVCVSDDDVDDLHRDMYEQVRSAIQRDPDQCGTLIQLLSVSRQLERIADHATNVAQDVIYMLKGEIVRHKPMDAEERRPPRKP